MPRNLIERAIFIRGTIIGRELPDPALRAIAEVVRELAFARGSIIAFEADAGDEMLLVLEGAVEVRKLGARPPPKATGDALGAVIGRFGPNDVLGEIAVLGEQARSATMVAAEDVVVLALHREDLRDAIAVCPDLAFGLFRVLIARIRRADERLTEPPSGGAE
jgi:CRP/FNR family transcriptional regulator, cyclic AMP receptor protein